MNTADVEWIDKQRENCFGIVDMNYGIVKTVSIVEQSTIPEDALAEMWEEFVIGIRAKS